MGNPLIYLDNCCFNRPFDDQEQLNIRIETESKLFSCAAIKVINPVDWFKEVFHD